jgi:opacity protein-like surface antigen
MLRTILAVIAMGICGTSVADNYVGFGAGQLGIEDSSFDANDVGMKLFGGWRLSDNVALELAYIHGGTPEDRGVEVDTRAMQVSALGALPLTDTIRIYGRVGLLSWKTEANGNGATVKTDGEDFCWGLGSTFSVGNRSAIRLEYEGADLDGADISFISLSGLIRFGAE